MIVVDDVDKKDPLPVFRGDPLIDKDMKLEAEIEPVEQPEFSTEESEVEEDDSEA